MLLQINSLLMQYMNVNPSRLSYPNKIVFLVDLQCSLIPDFCTETTRECSLRLDFIPITKLDAFSHANNQYKD